MATRDWEKLKVSAETRRFITETGFKRMTPVQAIAIPLLMNHRDMAVEACTGSGKTLSFLIPTVEILLRGSAPEAGGFHVGCVILSPTRELTTQIHEVLGSYLDAVAREDEASGAKIQRQLFVGGSDAKAAAHAIKVADAGGAYQVVVATPGRLRAIMKLTDKQSLNMKPLELLVLDEADRLLQLGFQLDLEAIMSSMPKQRRTGLFSATLTSELQRLMKSGMRNPVHVCVRLKRPEPAKPAKSIEDSQKEGEDKAAADADAPAVPPPPRHEMPTKLQNYYLILKAQQRLGFLVRFLEHPEVRHGKTIIFFLTCACVDYFHALLRELVPGGAPTTGRAAKAKGKKKKAVASLPEGPSGGRVEKLHGQMDQTARSRAYDKFCKAKPEDGVVLLATDLAARGIDVEAVHWVVQFDAPADPTAFIHRVGRTARAGQSGRSLALLLPHEDSYVPFLRQRSVPIEELPPLEGLDLEIGGSAGSKDPVLQRGRKVAETDRSVMLKGSKAFVSFIRAYQEHQLPYLFPFKSLDLGALAMGFCLLRVPRMKEVLGKKLAGFEQSAVHPADVPFRDKKQEKLRQEALKKKQDDVEAAEKAAQDAREKAKAQKKLEARQEKVRTRTQKRQAKRKNNRAEWELLAAEERLYKKVKRGKITEEEAEKMLNKVTKKIEAGKDPEDSDSDSDSEGGDGGGSDGSGDSD